MKTLTNDNIDRCLEIEQEVNTTPKPILGLYSIEDCDDIYQETLEYGWWLDEMIAEYKELNIILGFSNRNLFPIEDRRKV